MVPFAVLIALGAIATGAILFNTREVWLLKGQVQNGLHDDVKEIKTDVTKLRVSHAVTRKEISAVNEKTDELQKQVGQLLDHILDL